MNRTVVAAIGLLMVVTGVSACARPAALRPAGVDLVPLKRLNVPAPAGFCNVEPGSTRLIVSVKNEGDRESPPSLTMIEFSGGGAFALPTPAIPAQGAVDLPPLSIPASCPKAECGFKITVNSNNTVTEARTGNNVARGRCLG
jgi:hypothetical protein